MKHLNFFIFTVVLGLAGFPSTSHALGKKRTESKARAVSANTVVTHTETYTCDSSASELSAKLSHLSIFGEVKTPDGKPWEGGPAELSYAIPLGNSSLQGSIPIAVGANGAFSTILKLNAFPRDGIDFKRAHIFIKVAGVASSDAKISGNVAIAGQGCLQYLQGEVDLDLVTPTPPSPKDEKSTDIQANDLPPSAAATPAL